MGHIKNEVKSIRYSWMGLWDAHFNVIDAHFFGQSEDDKTKNSYENNIFYRSLDICLV